MTLYSRNSWSPCITDHHDVTEEDMHYANLGSDEELFWADFYAPKPRRLPDSERFPGRSKEWIAQYYASLRGRRDD